MQELVVSTYEEVSDCHVQGLEQQASAAPAAVEEQ
jgi:hypothetical protein